MWARALGRLAAAAAGAVLLAGCQGGGKADHELPDRAPGLWRETVSGDGGGQTRRICLDAAAARRLNLLGEELGRFDCGTDRSWREAEDAWGFEYRCDVTDHGRQTARGQVRGDMATGFTLTARSTIEGSPYPQADGARQTTIAAVREGPCPAGWRPGEVRLEDGKRLYVLNSRAVQ